MDYAVIGLLASALLAIGAYWAKRTDDRLKELEDKTELMGAAFARIETKLDLLLEQQQGEKEVH